MINRLLRILMLLWLLTAAGGAVVFFRPVFVGLNVVHAGARTKGRLYELQKAPPDFQPSAQQYREACADAKSIWEAMLADSSGSIFMLLGAVIGAASLLGWLLTDSLSGKIKKAQQGAPPLPRDPRASHSEGER